MKKLVVMAVVLAASIGVYAQDGYNFSASVKTTGAENKVRKLECYSSTNCYRVIKSEKLTGELYMTDCTTTTLFLENKKTDELYFDDDAVTFDILNVIGAKEKDVEMAFMVDDTAGANLGYAAWFQGFGKLDKNDDLSSASGSVLMFKLPKVCTVKCVLTTTPATYDNVCSLNGQYSAMTIAYGTWSMKYNSKL